MMNYRIIIEKGEDFGYVSHCPAIPGCHSQGNTLEEVIENIKDAISGCLEAMDADLIPLNNPQDQIYMEVAI
ncbi:MAG: type II toxin-antitoxin system HicB family antitoxin [Candidatus Kapabacteria bacterium]|nr:type II toxin-antitoxin system HicB family antitoxin [Candidatus Kapabacteria bacterium]